VNCLNNDFSALVAQYNDKFSGALSEMRIDSRCEFDDNYTFYLPNIRDLCGYIHVGKLSHGWKPLMQASEHFHSIQTLMQWHEENKQDYIFINEEDEVVAFDEYLAEINDRNQNPEAKEHEWSKGTDGFDWTHTRFS